MSARDDAWRRFVAAFDVEVPEQAIEDELAYIRLDLKHRMRYDHLSGGPAHPFPQAELDAQAEELRAAAVHEAKAPLVVAAIVEQQGIDATSDELAAYARDLCERQGSTMEMMRRFFGDDFGGLRRDVLERKAVDWACGQEG